MIHKETQLLYFIKGTPLEIKALQDQGYIVAKGFESYTQAIRFLEYTLQDNLYKIVGLFSSQCFKDCEQADYNYETSQFECTKYWCKGLWKDIYDQLIYRWFRDKKFETYLLKDQELCLI